MHSLVISTTVLPGDLLFFTDYFQSELAANN